MLEQVKHIHFMGIGGIGMSALALLLHDRGYQVSGCDGQDSELIQDLRQQGIPVAIGHDAAHLEGIDLLVYTSAIPEHHAERLACGDRGITQVRRADLLGAIAGEYHQTLAIAGTHGKTTTTGMLGLALEAAGLDPTVFVGGILPDFGSNLRLGTSDYLAVEADEYDRSFLTLKPSAALVTSLEPDHLDIYRDLADLQDTFRQFLSQSSAGSPIVVCADAENLVPVINRLGRPVITYGFNSNAQYTIHNVYQSAGTCRFQIQHDGMELCPVHLKVPGEHNILNATGVIALCHSLKIELSGVLSGLQHFRGVERRFQQRGTRRGVLFIDDYAHHPTEVTATLQAAKEGWPNARIVVVFQPHLFSRTRDFARDFAKALRMADLAVVAPIYPAREAPIPGVTSDLIRAAARREHWREPMLLESLDEIPEYLDDYLESGDIVITMGAGDIWRINDRILAEDL